MSLRANKFSVAVFVLGAVMLGGLMIYFFGARQMLARHLTLLMYFNDSVNGLAKGSPVKFKGVPIGQVESIRVRYKQAPGDTAVPVFVNVDLGRLRNNLGLLDDWSDPAVLTEKINQGLRAKLEVESYPAGTKSLILSFFPDAPPPPPLPPGLDIGVIPTLSSESLLDPKKLEGIVAWVQTHDLVTAAGNVKTLVDDANDRVSRLPFAQFNQAVLDPLQKANAYLSAWPNRLSRLVQQMTAIQTKLADTNGQIMQQAHNLIGMGQTVQGGIQRINDSLAATSAALQPGGAIPQQVNQAFGKIDDQAKSLQKQADDLEQQPSLLGK